MNNAPFNMFNTQYPSIAIDFIDSEFAVDSYRTLPGVMTFLFNWNTKTITIKEIDQRGVLKPYRYFKFEEFFPQAPAQQSNDNVQAQIDELKAMIAQLANGTNSSNNQNDYNKKGGSKG